MKKTLYLMRHGQTLFNARKKIQGWCDAPLTELGIKQAKIAGKYFKDNNIVFDHAYSSTSERACDTLELVCDLPHKVVLAVSHGGACRGFMRYWQETSQVDQKGGLKNCCILKFEFEDNEFRLLEIINHNFDETKG